MKSPVQTMQATFPKREKRKKNSTPYCVIIDSHYKEKKPLFYSPPLYIYICSYCRGTASQTVVDLISASGTIRLRPLRPRD